jgi:hypothetical protein
MLAATSIIGLIFTFALLAYWTCCFLILYHLIRFGVSGQPKKIAVVFLGGSIVLTIVTVLLYAQASNLPLPTIFSN